MLQRFDLATEMSRETEERLAEWAVWFHENRKRVPAGDVIKQNQFLLKAVDGCLEVLALTLKDIQILEQRNESRRLWLPSGVKLNGEITKFS